MLRTRDLLWLLAYPIYQLLGTLRHEASHAVMGMIEGARVQQLVFRPHLRETGWPIDWGHVSFDGPTTWLTTAAPYFVDPLTFGLFFLVCRYLRPPRWVWLNLVIIGMVSPLINSAYAYLSSFWRPSSDVTRLLREVPPCAVHVYFVVTMIAYVVELSAVLRRSRTACGSSVTADRREAGRAPGPRDPGGRRRPGPR